MTGDPLCAVCGEPFDQILDDGTLSGCGHLLPGTVPHEEALASLQTFRQEAGNAHEAVCAARTKLDAAALPDEVFEAEHVYGHAVANRADYHRLVDELLYKLGRIPWRPS